MNSLDHREYYEFLEARHKKHRAIGLCFWCDRFFKSILRFCDIV